MGLDSDYNWFSWWSAIMNSWVKTKEFIQHKNHHLNFICFLILLHLQGKYHKLSISKVHIVYVYDVHVLDYMCDLGCFFSNM